MLVHWEKSKKGTFVSKQCRRCHCLDVSKAAKNQGKKVCFAFKLGIEIVIQNSLKYSYYGGINFIKHALRFKYRGHFQQFQN